MNQAEEDALVESAWSKNCWMTNIEEMDERIRLAIRAAVAHERERCAKVCDERKDYFRVRLDFEKASGAKGCAAAIRRGE